MSAVDTKPLIQTKYAETSETTQYTATGVKTIIDKLTATNVTATNDTITVRLVPNGGTAGASNAIAYNVTVLAGKTHTFPEVVGHVLAAGDFVSTLAGAASSLVIRMSGREVS